MASSLVLPIESFCATVFPLVYAAKTVAFDTVDVFHELSKIAAPPDSSIEKLVGISDVVSHLLPFLSSLDLPLVFEVGINMLSLADIPGGKPEWASASIIAILTLWDRQEFSSTRESIVRAVVMNLHLLDLSMQVSLFKRLLLTVTSGSPPPMPLDASSPTTTSSSFATPPLHSSTVSPPGGTTSPPPLSTA